MFFGKFGKKHVFDDSYVYNLIDTFSADMQLEESSRNLKYCNSNMPLYAGFDPGPFMSIVFGQRQHGRPSTFRAIKNFWLIHPGEQVEFRQAPAGTGREDRYVFQVSSAKGNIFAL